MLVAAIPQSFEKGSALQLVLDMIANDKPIPENLVRELSLLLRKGIELASNHQTLTSEISEEAIDLAIKFRTDSELFEAVRNLEDISNIDKATATALLSNPGDKVAQFI